MTSLNIHNVKKITLSEIKDLDTSFSMNMLIEHKIAYTETKETTFEIVLFSDKRESLEKINFWIPIKE